MSDVTWDQMVEAIREREEAAERPRREAERVRRRREAEARRAAEIRTARVSVGGVPMSFACSSASMAEQVRCVAAASGPLPTATGLLPDGRLVLAPSITMERDGEDLLVRATGRPAMRAHGRRPSDAATFVALVAAQLLRPVPATGHHEADPEPSKETDR